MLIDSSNLESALEKFLFSLLKVICVNRLLWLLLLLLDRFDVNELVLIRVVIIAVDVDDDDDDDGSGVVSLFSAADDLFKSAFMLILAMIRTRSKAFNKLDIFIISLNS